MYGINVGDFVATITDSEAMSGYACEVADNGYDIKLVNVNHIKGYHLVEAFRKGRGQLSKLPNFTRVPVNLRHATVVLVIGPSETVGNLKLR